MNEFGLLTYQDREYFREILNNYDADSTISSEELVLNLSHILQNQQSKNADEIIFQEYTFDLLNILRSEDNKEACEIAKSALMFIATNYQSGHEKQWKLSAKQRAYITGLAIKEISGFINLTKANEIHGLTTEEKTKAEGLLLGLASISDKVDLTILNHAKDFIRLNKSKKQTRLLNRYLKNIQFLVETLESNKINTENMAWVRGALSYVRLVSRQSI